MVRSFLTARGTDLGFSPENRLSLYVNPAGERYESRRARAEFYDEVLEGVERVPGVEAAAVVDGLPLTGGVGWVRVVPEGREFEGRTVTYRSAPTSLTRHVSYGYFETMGIPLLAGRLPDERDRGDAPRGRRRGRAPRKPSVARGGSGGEASVRGLRRKVRRGVLDWRSGRCRWACSLRGHWRRTHG